MVSSLAATETSSRISRTICSTMTGRSDLAVASFLMSSLSYLESDLSRLPAAVSADFGSRSRPSFNQKILNYNCILFYFWTSCRTSHAQFSDLYEVSEFFLFFGSQLNQDPLCWFQTLLANLFFVYIFNCVELHYCPVEDQLSS
jgi:hypothetical protein